MVEWPNKLWKKGEDNLDGTPDYQIDFSDLKLAELALDPWNNILPAPRDWIGHVDEKNPYRLKSVSYCEPGKYTLTATINE